MLLDHKKMDQISEERAAGVNISKISNNQINDASD